MKIVEMRKKESNISKRESEGEYYGLFQRTGIAWRPCYFPYGMNLMGDGLAKVAGGKLERILETLTSNPIRAVLLGMGVTAVIQSSSATTVMVVGFVNSGIMKLSQVVGIIMGANIGTTVTSWILSLTGIQSDNFIIRLFKPTSFSPILALIGVVLIMFTKSQKKKDVGAIFVGFAILMYGMNAMSGAVEPLAEVPEFTGMLVKFSNPILGVVAGAVLTAIIQSSSASVGILQALCLTGMVPFSAALPIIMGQNIGTCITALLSSIGTSRNARRTAMVHLYFNIIGTVLFLVLFYGINAFVHFSIPGNLGKCSRHRNRSLRLQYFRNTDPVPVCRRTGQTCETDHSGRTGEKADEAVQMLDTRFLDSPAFALQQCKVAAAKMAELTETGLVTSVDLMASYNEADAENVDILEKKVDHFEDALGTYLVKLSSEKLSPKDSQTLSMILHCIGDFERISDHTVNIMKAAREMHDKNLQFSADGAAELAVYGKAVKDIVSLTFSVFNNEDVKKANEVEPLEQVIDSLNSSLKNHHIERLQSGKCTIELGFILSDVMTDFERISDHCSNIAVCVSQIHSGSFDTHEYLHALKKEEEFEAEYKELKKQYQLPDVKA